MSLGAGRDKAWLIAASPEDGVCCPAGMRFGGKEQSSPGSEKYTHGESRVNDERAMAGSITLRTMC